MRFVLAMSALLAISLLSATVHAETADTPGMANAVSEEASIVNGADAATAPVVNGTDAQEEEAGEAKPKAAAPELKAPEGLDVEVKEGRLSVNAKDQPFGVVIGAIANAAGFEVDLSNDVYNMKLSTRFKNSRLKRGILRLLSLIDQRNYTIDYAPDGSIKRLKVFGDLASGKRTITSPQPSAVSPPGRTTRTKPAPPTPPVLLIRDRERQRVRQPAASESQTDSESATEPSEPNEEEEIIELDYRIERLPGGDEDTDTDADAGQDDTSDDTNSDDTSDDTTGDDTSDGDYVEPQTIPEGDIPPDDQLLDAPLVPESSPPALP